MSKRKFNLKSRLEIEHSQKRLKSNDEKKHSLDSDEEDEVKDKGILHSDDIEGEEDGISRQETGVSITAFNMQEEMEEGHFDKSGHFIWNNEKEIRDNWLDNIDWQKIKDGGSSSQYNLTDNIEHLGDESDGSDHETFNETENYKKILEYMRPGETISKALNRHAGANKKLSSVERLRRKKAGTLVENEDVTKLTALANDNLTALGNMDIYQETYEAISQKIAKKINPLDTEQDMFADDFDNKQKPSTSTDKVENAQNNGEVMWIFKWSQESDEVHGPHSSAQMLKWVQEGYFKTGVFVRKHGEDSNFYTSNRIDFDLYV